VQKIREFYNIKGRLNFIIGTDAFSKIRTWYKVDELKNLVHFIVFPRGEDVIEPNDFKDFSYELADADKTDISSTEIRTAKKRETVKEVEEYIVKNRLYD
jgi:nicotinic acid mononucleotide adenylyltransferase